MTPNEYESVVAKIAEGIRTSATDLGDLVIGLGRNNRIVGASAYRHQIDVSLSGNNRIFIIECKMWGRRAGVQEILVLASRSQDIRDQHPGTSVTAILVSTQGASRGASKIAQHFGIAIEITKSPANFGLRIGQSIHQGISIGVASSLSVEETVVRNGVVLDES
ncbi:MAG: hypothetical protein WBG50_26935 [Desulfomonilaceae bacterium]